MVEFEDLVRGDRVRANTPLEINEAIESEIAATVRFYTGKTDYEISKRIEDLDKEWDIERYLEANAAIFSFTGTILGLKKNGKWFILTILVSIFLFQHAVQGWCPPVSLFRRFFIRTRKEIEAEKYSLRALRGDFGKVSFHESETASAREVFNGSKII